MLHLELLQGRLALPGRTLGEPLDNVSEILLGLSPPEVDRVAATATLAERVDDANGEAKVVAAVLADGRLRVEAVAKLAALPEVLGRLQGQAGEHREGDD